MIVGLNLKEYRRMMLSFGYCAQMKANLWKLTTNLILKVQGWKILWLLIFLLKFMILFVKYFIMSKASNVLVVSGSLTSAHFDQITIIHMNLIVLVFHCYFDKFGFHKLFFVLRNINVTLILQTISFWVIFDDCFECFGWNNC